ncbi:capsular polysaccharide biosynthesis protein [Geomicrobium halophilum]|uniref:Capsular polysaccharide biosynthesis protein n=1 Tax=Geomicrobium halophilum TaxID=549000 RepID=A0A841PUA7_9BACL|nr:Wzz/FepE/Etk N-terminal domain-containing protein [Geomicrobium halophilum]MBB6449881.1 capsular polysaccharide biosynthesis protein [Geomicrobium halophilum]
MEETISLKEILETLKKRWLMIVLITVGAVGISAIVSFFVMTPQYEASTQLLVNQGQEQQQENFDVGDIDTNVELINTYSVIITSPAILDLVIEETGLERSYSQLEEQVDVNPEGESQVVSVSVTDPDPQTAITLADTTAAVFQEEVETIMNIDNVSILSSANSGEEMTPVSPQPVLNMAIAFVVGLMVSLGLAFLLEFLDNTIRNEQDIEKELGLAVLGVIPKMDEADVKSEGPRSQMQRRGGYNVQKISQIK